METKIKEAAPNPALEPEEIVWIGKNEHDYTFGVARIGETWHGFARGELPPPETAMIFFFPFDGMQDKNKAIKKTVAFAFDFENGYGGISQWAPEFINDVEVQKAQAADFCCEKCETPFCDGDCDDYPWCGDFDRDDDLNPF